MFPSKKIFLYRPQETPHKPHSLRLGFCRVWIKKFGPELLKHRLQISRQNHPMMHIYKMLLSQKGNLWQCYACYISVHPILYSVSACSVTITNQTGPPIILMISAGAIRSVLPKKHLPHTQTWNLSRWSGMCMQNAKECCAATTSTTRTKRSTPKTLNHQQISPARKTSITLLQSKPAKQNAQNSKHCHTLRI